MPDIMEKMKWGIMIESYLVEGLPQEGILELVPKEWEGGSQEDTFGKSIPSRRKINCQGSELGTAWHV